MSLGLRLAMVLVGLGVFGLYALGAVGLYLLLQWLVRGAALGATALVLLVFVTVGAYLNYRSGPARLVAGLDARELSRGRAPGVYRRFDRLASEMGVDPPALLVADLGVPNALSVGGPRQSAVVLDRRLFEVLSADELEGILAHELAHVRGYDTFVQTVALSLVRALAGVAGLVLSPLLLLAYGLDRGLAWATGRPAREASVGEWVRLGAVVAVGLLLSVFTLAVLAYARRREFVADARAAEATGNPRALARALWKIRRATESMYGLRSLLYTHGESDYRLLSTHPPLEERVRRLSGGPEGPPVRGRR
jgi:heat shock protein HtpX